MAVALECRSVCFRYAKRQILKNISFEASNGQFHAILGRNGSGKTTLLHCLNGILKTESGDIRINTMDLKTLSHRGIARHISLVPQEHLEIFPFTVLEVVVMGRTPFLALTGSPGKTDYQMALEALTLLNARNLADCRYNTISGGERQIVSLASAMVQSTEIMLLDEPTNHLDFNHQYHLLARVRHLCRTHGSCVIASMHDPNLARLFADHVLMMDDGAVVAAGPAEQTLTTETLDRLYGTRTRKIPITGTKAFFLPEHILEE
ncbi:MAG: ABC transporter ATP-binding protein [Pseudomonadota bacterium]